MAHKVSCNLGAGLFWDAISWLVVVAGWFGLVLLAIEMMK